MNGKTCIMNWLSCIRWLLANWLRSNGMHDKNNGQSLSHLKWACLSGSSPSSESIASMNSVVLNESIASDFDLLIVIVSLFWCVLHCWFKIRTYINLKGFTHPVNTQIQSTSKLINWNVTFNLIQHVKPVTIGLAVAIATLSSCKCGGSNSIKCNAPFLIRSREIDAAKCMRLFQMCS